MKHPVTNAAVMLPNGRTIYVIPNVSNHYAEIHGLACGPVILEGDERFAVRDLLVLIYPDEA